MKSTLGIVSSSLNATPAGSTVPGMPAVLWRHAYWTEGPEFVALGLSDGAAVDTWPDEAGTANLVQATAANKPTYRAAHAPLGSRPALDADGGDWMAVTVPRILQPYTVVAVAEGVTQGKLVMGLDGDASWTFYNSGGVFQANLGAFISGPTQDSGDHLFVLVANGASSQLIVDGTAGTGNPGTGSVADMRFAGIPSGFGLTGAASFIGIAAGVLSAGELDDLHIWAQSHYGTP